jgi:hypothetical protein
MIWPTFATPRELRLALRRRLHDRRIIPRPRDWRIIRRIICYDWLWLPVRTARRRLRLTAVNDWRHRHCAIVRPRQARHPRRHRPLRRHWRRWVPVLP